MLMWKSQAVCNAVHNQEMLLHYNFLSFIMQPLNDFNTTFQADESRFGFLHSEMTTLLRKFLGKFVKSKLIQTIPDPANQLNDNILAVGVSTRAVIIDNDIPDGTLKRFFSSVRAFYVAVVNKMVQKFPFGDPVVSSLTFLNPTSRGDIDPTTVTSIAARFPNIINNQQLKDLLDDFTDYQVTPSSEMPVYTEEKTRVDQYWDKVLKMRNLITRTPRFPLMSKIVAAVLTIPNSNADCERVFSMVKRKRTDVRSSLDNLTITSLLTAKINSSADCN